MVRSRCRAALVVLAVGLLAACSESGPDTDGAGPQRSLVMSAFGDASFGEAQPYLQALQDTSDRTGESVFCQSVQEGTLSGQPVAVVVTGTGSANAGPCLQEMLGWYGEQVSEVIWSGVAGASPAVGGIVDDAGVRRPDAEPVMIGDVCISPMMWSDDLQFSSVSDWAAARTPTDRYGPSGGWWPMRTADGQATMDGFQTVRQFVVAPTGLADELLEASRDVGFPALDGDVREEVERFFAPDAIRPVRVFDYTTCAEVSGDDFFHGAVEDAQAREYLAGLIDASGYPGTDGRTAADVVAFTGMEAAGWMSVLQAWNEHHTPEIPMVVVRAASNYDQVPLDAAGDPVAGPDGAPLDAMQDITIGFDDASAELAIRTASLPVLQLFASRAGAG
ncbi:MAG: hypothetical protein IPM45_14415 [Acidimicrobiales bacterium]|nr:hypothetical protein [Acidimicrobiales bacterium]